MIKKFIENWLRNEYQRRYDEMEIKLKEDIWIQGFTAGVSKSWDLLTPIMVGNIEKLKDKIRDEATEEAIRRMTHGNP